MGGWVEFVKIRRVVKMQTSYVHAPEGGPIRGRRVSHSRAAAAEGVTFVVGCNANCLLPEGGAVRKQPWDFHGKFNSIPAFTAPNSMWFRISLHNDKNGAEN